MIEGLKTRNIIVIPIFRNTEMFNIVGSVAQKEMLISSITNKYCKDINVKIVFSPFKFSIMFSPKDFVPDSLKSRVVYQLNVRAVELVPLVKRLFNTRVNEHLFRDKFKS